MKIFILCLALFSCLPEHVIAQEITDEPICFTLRNDANHRVYGSVSTAYVTNQYGLKIHYDGSFRLEAKGTTDPETGYEKDITEFCSSGPFFPGRKLEITLRTLIPVFSCKSSVEVGEIVIHSQTIMKDGVEVKKMWATCY